VAGASTGAARQRARRRGRGRRTLLDAEADDSRGRATLTSRPTAPYNRIMPGRALLVLALALAACTPMRAQYDIRRRDLSCEAANRYAFQSMRSLGYAESQFQPAAVGREGLIKGRKRELRSGDREVTRTGVVRIQCSPGEVFLTAREEQLLSQDITFTRGFYLAFTGLADYAGASQAQAEVESGGVKSGGVKFKIQPQLGLESKLDFGEDLAGGGVLAVRVTVQNGSDRAYTLEPAAIELRSAAGEGKVPQMPIPAAAAAVARAAAAAAGEGAPPPDPARVEAMLRERALRGGKLGPGDQAEGFVYFPAGRYSRARATLIDVETKESEGFLVEF